MRLIDADALVKELGSKWNVLDDQDFANKAVWRTIEAAPTVDVPDRKVGKWEHHIGIGNVALLKCGECGFTYPELLGMMLFKFCPNCGAKMERSEE